MGRKDYKGRKEPYPSRAGDQGRQDGIDTARASQDHSCCQPVAVLITPGPRRAEEVNAGFITNVNPSS